MAGPDDPPSGGGDGGDDEPRDDEPRARDIASAKSTADLDEKMDPETVAQLARWFGLPSFAQLEEQQAAASAPPVEENPIHAERRELLARIAAEVDPALLARLWAQPARADALRKFDHPPEPHITEHPLLHDEEFSSRFAGTADGRDFQRPPWIDGALEDQTPQAILRDLHRPEDSYPKYFEQGAAEPAVGHELTDVRTVVATRLQVRPEEPLAIQRIDRALADLRRMMRLDWTTLPYRRSPPGQGS